MDFIPLELWRASSLTSETKGVIAAYERCLAQGDFEALAALRAAIEVSCGGRSGAATRARARSAADPRRPSFFLPPSRAPPLPRSTRSCLQGRIAELDDFYTAHLDDERALLFDKQRMKLRKLLHEYDSAVASLQAQGGGAGGGAGFGAASASGASAAPSSAASSPSQHFSIAAQQQGGGGGGAAGGGGGASGGGSVTRDITEKSRLTLAELSAWFSQAGFAELRDVTASGEVRAEVTLPVLAQVFRNVTRTKCVARAGPLFRESGRGNPLTD